MTPPTDAEMTMGEVARALARIEVGQAELRQDLGRLSRGFVSRGEYDAWRDGISREIRHVKDEVADAKTAAAADIADINARRSPWTSVVTVVLSSAALLMALIPRLAGG